jgi:hypothetical protein
MARDTLSRSLHDLGLAAWFGGTLANAVALNPPRRAPTRRPAPERSPTPAGTGGPR